MSKRVKEKLRYPDFEFVRKVNKRELDKVRVVSSRNKDSNMTT